MNIDQVTVGILTAAYNSAKFFPDYWNGLINQTKKPDIIYYINDCSTDNTDQVIESYLSEIKKSGIKFNYIKKDKNEGAAITRNIGLDKLVDEVDTIFINDSDDYFEKEKVEKSVESMLKFPKSGLVYSDYFILDESTGKKKREFKEIFSFSKLQQECIISNASAISTAILKAYNIRYDEDIKYCEDYSMWMKIAEKSSCKHISKPLYTYRLWGNNVTVKTPAKDFGEQVQKVHQKAYDRRMINAQ